MKLPAPTCELQPARSLFSARTVRYFAIVCCCFCGPLQVALSFADEVLATKTAETISRFTLVGTLKPGAKTQYSLNGEDFSIDNAATIDGEMKLDAYVEVSGPVSTASQKVVDRVIVLPPASAVSSDTGGEGTLVRQR